MNKMISFELMGAAALHEAKNAGLWFPVADGFVCEGQLNNTLDTAIDTLVGIKQRALGGYYLTGDFGTQVVVNHDNANKLSIIANLKRTKDGEYVYSPQDAYRVELMEAHTDFEIPNSEVVDEAGVVIKETAVIYKGDRFFKATPSKLAA